MHQAGHRNMLTRYRKECRRNLLATPGPCTFVLVLDHLKAGYNVAKIFRSALAFGARAVHLVGIGPFDPAPAKGALRKVPLRHHESMTGCLPELLAAGYTPLILEPGGGEPLPAVDLPEKSAFILGHEEFGFSFDRTAVPALRSLAIPQPGAVQSLNVSIAASIVMYEYLRQHPA